jgi:TRAP-type C4-dicarboxylate transport system substrate-binding protein
MMVPSGNANAAEKVYVLKQADYFPVGHPGYKTNVEAHARLEKTSKGQIDMQYYPAEQLAKAKDLLNACRKGIADIVNVQLAYYAGSFPLSTVCMLPNWTHARDGAEIMQRLYDSSPEIREEFSKFGILPLMLTCIPQYDIGTVSKPVRTPEDCKGLRLKVSGGTFTMIAKRYGINPTSIAAPEAYEALQRGILDGCTFTFGSVKGYRVFELEKYHTLGLRMGGQYTMIVINDKAWANLPKHIQRILIEDFKIQNKDTVTLWDQMNIDLSNQYEKEYGMQIYRVPPEDRAMWEAPLQGIGDEWAESMEQRGLPGKKVLEQYLKICKEVVK